MSVLLPVPLQKGPFEYVTVSRLREEGLPDSVSDETALRRIWDAGDTITAITGCPFVPIDVEEIFVDGRGSGIIYLPNKIPIVKIRNIHLVAYETNGTKQLELVDPVLYIVKRKYIESVSPMTRHYQGTVTQRGMWMIQNARPFLWPELADGVRLNGVFGWLDRQRDLTLIVATDAAAGDTSIEVQDAFDVRADDVLLFASGERKIVTSVERQADPAPDIIYFEGQLLENDVLTDAEVKVYGAVPRLLMKAALLLVMQNQKPIGSTCYQDDRKMDRIKTERTDNYSYTLESGKWDGSSSLTGNEEVDNILRLFMPSDPILVSV